MPHSYGSIIGRLRQGFKARLGYYVRLCQNNNYNKKQRKQKKQSEKPVENCEPRVRVPRREVLVCRHIRKPLRLLKGWEWRLICTVC